MLLGLDMADQVDQSFVKVHFHRMTIEYFNWLVNKIMDKETNMASMRKQFLKDNQDKHRDNNYEFKMRDKDDKVPPQMEPTNNQRRKDWRKNDSLISGFEHVYFKSSFKTFSFRNYLGLSGIGFYLGFDFFRVFFIKKNGFKVLVFRFM